MTIPGSAGLINNNTNINVNAGAGSVVNVAVINTNILGPALYPFGPMDMFGGGSPYLFPALLPSFLGAPRVDLLPFSGPGRTNASPAVAADAPAPGSSPVAEPFEKQRKEPGCAGLDHSYRPHKSHSAHNPAACFHDKSV